MATAMPLHGKTVLITRLKSQAGEFARLLEERGAAVVFVPTIEIVSPESWHQFDAAIRTIRDYDAIVFTSANGVRAFFQALNDRGNTSARNELGKKQFYVVGAITGEALTSEGFAPTAFPGVENAQQLAEALARTSISGKRFMVPRGNLANEGPGKTLRSQGARVDEIIVYETVAPRDEDATSVRQKLEEQSIDIVAFFSPSSVKNLLTLVPRELLASKTIAVIGTTTEAAATEAGLTVHVTSPQPTSADLVDAIVQYLKE